MKSTVRISTHSKVKDIHAPRFAVHPATEEVDTTVTLIQPLLPSALEAQLPGKGCPL